MRKISQCLLAAAMLFLCACGGTENPQSEFDALRAQISKAAVVSVKAEVTADYGNKIMTYTLEYTETNGDGIITVMSPDSIAGIKARCAGGVTIEYEGVMLDVGDLSGDGLSPISALPAIVSSIRSGHIESYSSTSGETVVELTVSGNSSQCLWIDSDSKLPLRSEIRSGERVVITCVILEWKNNE